MPVKKRRPDAPKRRPGRPRSIDFGKVERLAARGVAERDIIAALGIPRDVVRRKRELLEVIVAVGHARHRIRLADRLDREGIQKGRSHALLALAREHLQFDKPAPAPAPPYVRDIADVSTRLLDLLSKAGRAQRRREADELAQLEPQGRPS